MGTLTLQCRDLDSPERAIVESDEYIPLIVRWDAFYRTLETPFSTVITGPGSFLEFQFDRDSHSIIELVCLDIKYLNRYELDLSPLTSNEEMTVYAENPPLNAESELTEFAAYNDCLEISLERTSVSRWVGKRPVLFGVSADGTASKIALFWSAETREQALDTIDFANQSRQN